MLCVVDMTTFFGQLDRRRFIELHRQSGHYAVATLPDYTRGHRKNTQT